MNEMCVYPYCGSGVFYSETPKCTDCDDGWLNKCMDCELWSRHREGTNTQEELSEELRIDLGLS